MADPNGRTANERAFDETVRRKVRILRFAEGEAERVRDILAEVERDILERITGALASGLTVERLEALLRSVHALQEAGFGRVEEQVAADLAEFAAEEAAWEKAMLERVTPVAIELAAVPLETLLVASRSPVQGLTLDRWLDGIGEAEVQAIERAIRLGTAQGETIDQMVGRIRGTSDASYNDGILALARREAESLVRTAVNHVSNEARELVWAANQDLILCLRWTSTLDGRTTDICRARDGRVAPVDGQEAVPEHVRGDRLDPPGARPPAHFNCRSVMVPVIDPEGIVGSRPYVRDDRTREEREREFRREARERGVPIQQVRREWAQRVVGQVPASMTYQEWLAMQPEDFQDDVLGPARGQMFREGMKLERFVDHSGRRLTLDELRAG